MHFPKHLHVYYDVREVLLDAASFAESIGNVSAADLLRNHAKQFKSGLICRVCRHKWSL